MRVTIDGTDLHYEVHGRGEPVLLIHGFPLSGRLWDGVVARLRGRYRLIVPDLRGHGDSGATTEVSMGRFAADLAAILEEIGEKRPAVLVGMSMGGYVAFEFWRRYPDRVRALALVDTRAARDTAEAARARHELADRVLLEGSGVVADGMIDRLFAPDAPAELRERWRTIMAATPPEGVAAALRAMARRRGSVRTLRRMDVPTLVVVGAEDVITPPAEARAMAEAAPGATLRVIPGAGHMTPVERPEALGEVIGDFVRGLDVAHRGFSTAPHPPASS